MALLRRKLRLLGGWLADLKGRIRIALAGELARAISEAVGQVVVALVSGRKDDREPEPTRSCSEPDWDSGPEYSEPRDPWDDEPDDRYRPMAAPHREPVEPTPQVEMPNPAIAAGVHAARWWWRRRGNTLAACGIGLGIGLLGTFGGPVVRAVLGIASAAVELLGLTDALGSGAAWIQQL